MVVIWKKRRGALKIINSILSILRKKRKHLCTYCGTNSREYEMIFFDPNGAFLDASEWSLSPGAASAGTSASNVYANDPRRQAGWYHGPCAQGAMLPMIFPAFVAGPADI